MAGFHMGEKPLCQVREHRRSFARLDSHFAHRKSGTLRRFDLASRAGVSLLCALLDVLPVEHEVIPVLVSTFEDAHGFPL